MEDTDLSHGELFRISDGGDEDPLRGIMFQVFRERARLFDAAAKKPCCEHVHDRVALQMHLKRRSPKDPLCPKCPSPSPSPSGSPSLRLGKDTIDSNDFRAVKPVAQPVRRVEEMFDAFNLEPNEFAAHDPIPEIDGPPPRFLKGRMKWRPSDGRTGWVPMRDGRRLRADEYHGMALPGTPDVSDEDVVPLEEVSEFEIAYTVAYPATREIGKLDDLPIIGLLHGVPGNRRWKYRMMQELGKFAVVVAFDMLGMGESDQVLEYRRPWRFVEDPDSEPHLIEEPNEAWDWQHDVPYIHQLMIKHIPDVLTMTPKKWVFEADDWGAGPALWYAAMYPDWLLHSFFVCPVWLDGYFVIEIGTIGRMAAVRRKNPAAFMQGAFALPQILVGVEKYMVEERWKMNRYTETDYLFPYQDVNYQAGKTAAEMQPNFWNLAVLADRSSRLAPRQLQPFHKTRNPYGIHFDEVTAPVDFVWGKKDQMMPPSQVFRSVYLFPNAKVAHHEIQNANHFAEIDDPLAVVRAILGGLLREHGKKIVPVFLGNGDYIMKGDERELKERLTKLYDAPRTHAP